MVTWNTLGLIALGLIAAALLIVGFFRGLVIAPSAATASEERKGCATMLVGLALFIAVIGAFIGWWQ